MKAIPSKICSDVPENPPNKDENTNAKITLEIIARALPI